MKKSFQVCFLFLLISLSGKLLGSNPPVAHYTFSSRYSTTQDYGSYNITGMNYGAEFTIGITGDSGAYSFDGISDKVHCGTSDRGITNKVTVSAWIKTTSNTAKTQVVLSKYNFSSDNKGYNLLIVAGKPRFDGRDGSGSYRSSGSAATNIADGNWHLLTGIVNVDKWEIWVDGVKESETSTGYTATDLTNSSPLVLGYLIVNNDFFYQGVIDEVVIHNYVLSSDEINVLLMNKNLTAFYPLAGNSFDRSDLYMHGGFSGSPTVATGHTSVSNTAYSFDGNDRISINNHNRFVTNAVTVAAWVKTTSLAKQFIVDKYWVTGYHLYLDNGKAGFAGRDGSGNYRNVAGLNAINDGNWHFLTGVVNNGTWQIWVDGSKVGEQVTGYTSTDLINSAPLVFGYNYSTSNHYFNGVIDDIRIYNTALSASKIQQLYSYNIEALRTGFSSVPAYGVSVPTVGEDVFVYPNPSEDMINIDTKGQRYGKIQLVDTRGRVITEAGDSYQMSLHGLPSGMYIVLFKDAEGQIIKTSKVIKK